MKKKEYEIVLIEEYEKVNFYSLKEKDEIKSEYEKFLEYCKSKPEILPDFYKFLRLMDKIKEIGAVERKFRICESKMRDNVCAIPMEINKLRLYCLRISDSILILGNGGIKNMRIYNEIPLLNNSVKLLAKLDFRLKEKIKNKQIEIKGKYILGNLKITL